ncbi:epithelial membrane protein 1-like [Physella acuta]|uniref:epithelial membrane protein 1-like n=1 Tax=Physella acuta TaxID=109671 RepID=UPI0027DB085E|nr:epithelial membrane protein 1-like [Physella acuta]
MGLKDGFMGADLLVKISAVIVLVTQIFNWMAFCTSSWYINTAANSHLGLWRSCSNVFGAGCGITDGAANDDFAATQTFAIFGFIALNVGCLLIILYMFFGSCKGNKEVGISSGVALIFSAVSWLIAVIVFAAYIDDWVTDPKFGFSFALAIVALILALVAGILMLVASLKGGSVGAK